MCACGNKNTLKSTNSGINKTQVEIHKKKKLPKMDPPTCIFHSWM